jgi:hypothetical protein
MGEKHHGLGRWLYSSWLAVATPAVRLSFAIRRAAGWPQASRRPRFMLVLGTLPARGVGPDPERQRSVTGHRVVRRPGPHGRGRILNVDNVAYSRPFSWTVRIEK